MLWEFYQEFLNQGISHRTRHPAVHTDFLSVAVVLVRTWGIADFAENLSFGTIILV